MKVDYLKEKIAIARKAVEGEDEPFKTAAFTTILSKLIDHDHTTNKNHHKPQKTLIHQSPAQTIPSETISIDIEKAKEELTKSCGITIKELDDMVSLNRGMVQIISPIKGKETDKQIVATQCILIIHEVVLGVEWVSSSLLRKYIDLSGIGELDHLARNIRRNPNLIRARGKKPNLEYKLFGPGRVSAIALIRKLAKGENSNEN